MVYLDQFSEADRDLIVSLPYRAGLWLSDSDSGGGAEADYEELSRLEDVLEKKSPVAARSRFIGEVMAETLARQDLWKQWAARRDSVPEDCARAAALIAAGLSARDAADYREQVMRIATEVAAAFGEPSPRASCCPFSFAGRWICRFFARFCRDGSSGEGNISAGEKQALAKLDEALRPPQEKKT